MGGKTFEKDRINYSIRGAMLYIFTGETLLPILDCFFPFVYENVRYYICGNNGWDRPWCPTDIIKETGRLPKNKDALVVIHLI